MIGNGPAPRTADFATAIEMEGGPECLCSSPEHIYKLRLSPSFPFFLFSFTSIHQPLCLYPVSKVSAISFSIAIEHFIRFLADMLSSIILAFLAINACTASPRLQVRAPCDDQHALCVAPDPEEYDTPKVGREIRHLLEDLRHSIATNHVTKRGVKPVGAALVERDPQYDLCCKSGFIHRRQKQSQVY